jgi:hypothetical protein
MKKFPRENDTGSSRKKDFDNCLESQWFPHYECSSKGIKFNADHYITDVLARLTEWRKTQVARTDRKPIVHTDDACLHTAKMSLDFLEQNGMRKAPPPGYSLDLAPSDFYLFGHVKQLLAGHEFSDRGALLDSVQGILWNIKKLP